MSESEDARERDDRHRGNRSHHGDGLGDENPPREHGEDDLPKRESDGIAQRTEEPGLLQHEARQNELDALIYPELVLVISLGRCKQ